MTKRYTVIVEGREYNVDVEDLGDRPIRATVNQKTYHVYVRSQDGRQVADVRLASNDIPPEPPAPESPARPPGAPTPAEAAIRAPMPGDIVELRVKAGDSVQPGDVVCVLEAMKMKNLIHTAQAGMVASVEVEVGQSVDYGAVLVTLA
jgi:biotin carboxyl carrier protein